MDWLKKADRRRPDRRKGQSMKTLKELFHYYGSEQTTMNERFYLTFTRADKIESLERVRNSDKEAERKIAEFLEYIEVLKEYRKTLFNRAQEIYAASYRLQLKIKRTVDNWKNKKYYTVTLSKIYEESARIAPENLIDETYDGKDRAKALKRFDDLQKEYPNVEAVKEVDKYQWEK